MVDNVLSEGKPQSRWDHWMVRHELTLFFAFTFLFSWTAYGLAARAPIENNTVLSRILLIGAYGPSLSAMVLSRMQNPSPGKRASWKWPALFIVAMIVAASVEWLDHIWWRHQVDTELIVIDSILVMLAAMVVIQSLAGHSGTPSGSIGWIKSWNWLWIVVVLALWPVVTLTGNAIGTAVGISLPPKPVWPDVPLLLIVGESFFWTALFGGPLNEEPGWRGYALPRLQRRFSPMVASIILGSIWGIWHIPLHLMGVYYGGALGAVIRLQEIPRAVLFTWIYNRAHGNLLMMILFHAAINTTSLFLPRSYLIVFILCFLLAAAVIVRDKMWLKSALRARRSQVTSKEDDPE